MQIRFRFITLIFVALTTASLAAQARPAETMLEAARKMEVVDGNYQAAIKQYQSIVDKFAKTDRASAATALIRMAECQQELGDSQAKATLEKIVKDFSDQTSQVAEARMKLGTAAPNAGDLVRSGLREGLLCSGAGCLGQVSSISADGRWATRLELNGDMQVVNLTTLAVERKFTLSTPAGIGGVNWTLFSPDSRSIAFVWFDSFAWGGAAARGRARYSLHVISNETGAKPRALLDSQEFTGVEIESWSTDGNRLLVSLQRDDRTTALAWMTLADGSMRVIKSAPVHLPLQSASLSPDGRYIAFVSGETKDVNVPPARDSFEYRLYVMSSDGQGPISYVDTLGNRGDRPFWSPDGSYLLYTSDRSGAIDLWAEPMRDGAPGGQALRVKPGIGTVSRLGVTRGGLFYYTQRRDGLAEILVAGIDFNGKLPVTPRIQSSVSVAGGSWPTWSPDGQHVAYVRSTSRNPPVGPYSVVVHSLSTNKNTVYNHMGPISSSPQWKPDSTGILFMGAPTAATRGPQRGWYSAGPGEDRVTEVLAPSSAHSSYGVLSKDGTTIFEFQPEDATRFRRLTAVDIASGKFTTLHTAESYLVSPPALSPDGRTLAFGYFSVGRNEWTFATIGTDGTAYKEIGSDPGGGGLRYVAWTTDGRKLLFTQTASTPLFQESTTRCRLMRIELESRKQEFSGLEVNGSCWGFALSPDGARVAIPQRGAATWDFSVFDVSAAALAKKAR